MENIRKMSNSELINGLHSSIREKIARELGSTLSRSSNIDHDNGDIKAYKDAIKKKMDECDRLVKLEEERELRRVYDNCT